MRFITVVDKSKLLELINSFHLTNNLLYDFPPNVLEEIKERLEDLTGLDYNPVLGVVVGNDFNLQSSWNSVSSMLPVKSNDILVQFNLSEDEMLFGDFNRVMGLLYSNSNQSLDEIFDYYAPNDDCIGVVSEVPKKTFECGYVIKDDFSQGTLDCGNGLAVVEDVGELQRICQSTVF